MTFRLTIQDPPRRRAEPRETKTHAINPDTGDSYCGRFRVEVAGGSPTCKVCARAVGGETLPGQMLLPSAVADPDPLPW